MSKIGLVTVLFKSDEVLDGFFAGIALQQHTDYILYLVDNSPNDKTDEIIRHCLQKYTITSCQHIKSSGNIGVAAGNNVGIYQGLKDGCSHILLLNNDIEIEQDFVFSTLLAVCTEKGEPMAVPKIFYHPGGKLWMAGGTMNKWRALGIHTGYKQEDAPQYNVAKPITYAPTCFMLIDRSVFEKVGYMDEKYFAYYDDTDFVLRAGMKGLFIYYEPSVYILHKVSFSSGGDDSPFYIYYSNRNKLYFIRKNLRGVVKWFALLSTLFIRFFYLFKYDKAKRKKLKEGIRDGLRYPIG
jgi:GT2 family glycosyltransferase